MLFFFFTSLGEVFKGLKRRILKPLERLLVILNQQLSRN